MRKNSSKKHGVNSILNRSQSAMEYLMTYGWAILIIAIVLVALFSLGIFNSANFAPRAQPGSCEVLRNSAQTSLVGQCNGMLPEYVAQFNGQNASVSFGNGQSLSPEAGSNGKMTLCLWYAVLSFSGYRGPLLKGEGGPSAGNGWEYTLDQNGNNLEGFSLFNRVGGTIADYNVGSLPVDTWIFSCFTYDYPAQQSYYYINGAPHVAAATWSLGPATAGTGNLVLGYGEGGYSNIKAANLQIYNTSLSNSSIQALYKEGIGGAPINVNNLVGWWPLNGNANDYSGNDNNGVSANVTYTSAWTSGYSAP